MNSGAWRIVSTSEPSLIPDLRHTGLGQLASHAATGERDVTGVVSRTVVSQERISYVPAMMFSSTI